MTHESPDFSKYRFLIADDRAFLRSVIQSILVRCSARDIKHAPNGIEAMKVLTDARGTIDCVFCDWNMAPLDGLTLLRAIRSGDVRHTPRDTRVLMLTGYSDEKVVSLAIAMGANGYIVKPASRDRVVGAVNNAFSRTIVLKTPEAYRAMEVVDLPNTGANDAKGASPWILWSRMRGRSRGEMAKHLDLIRLEGEALSKEQVESRRPMKNIQKMNMSSVVPNQILAEDLFDEEGRLLLVSGTKLNESLLQRLKELVDGEETQVMIGEFVV